MADVKQLLMFNKIEYCMYPHTPHQDRRVLFHRVTQRHELIWHKRAARSLSCQSVCVCWLKGLFQSFLRSGRFWVTLRILNGLQWSTGVYSVHVWFSPTKNDEFCGFTPCFSQTRLMPVFRSWIHWRCMIHMHLFYWLNSTNMIEYSIYHSIYWS